MEKMNTYIAGNTVKLEGEFRNFEGNLVNVQFSKVIIYDFKYNKIGEFNLGDSNKVSDGKYLYNFVTDKTPKKYIYEFYGELNGLPAIDRGMFVTKFI